jgi:hypothetical protein
MNDLKALRDRGKQIAYEIHVYHVHGPQARKPRFKNSHGIDVRSAQITLG